MSYSAYLEEHVQAQLTKAIAAATLQNPKDAVDFIGQFLLKIVEEDAKSKETAEIHASWAKEDQQLEVQRKEQDLIVQQKADAQKAKLTEEEQFDVGLHRRAVPAQTGGRRCQRRALQRRVVQSRPISAAHDAGPIGDQRRRV